MSTALPSLLLAALATASPVRRSPSHERLHTQCLLHAADPRNPWALAHGITGLGRAYAAKDGRAAAQVIVGDFLQKASSAEAMPYGFARYAPDGTPIEPHTNLHAKTLVLAGLPLSTQFKPAFGKLTLQALVDGVKHGFRHVPANEDYWRDAAWTLDLLAATHKPGSARFKNGAGEQIDLNDVFGDALAYLEHAQEDLAAGMDKGLPQVAKRKQGIYAHTCGGLHLFQAVGHWARHPEVRKRWGTRWDRQVAVLFYRLGSEARQYDAALEQAPQYKLQILTQMVKFYGHFLETSGRLKAEGTWKPDQAQRREVEKAKALLDRAVRELEEMKAFDSMEQLRVTQRQVYLDLIGDSCHATHGLDFWR